LTANATVRPVDAGRFMQTICPPAGRRRDHRSVLNAVVSTERFYVMIVVKAIGVWGIQP